MTRPTDDLAALGWNEAFAAQLSPEERERARPARVAAQHRNRLQLLGPDVPPDIPPFADALEDTAATVGDWLLIDRDNSRARRLLARTSLIRRRAAGCESRLQAVAANIDTLLIVSSCNADFNPARLERYLVLALEAGVTPLVVLTKADETADPAPFVAAARRLRPQLLVEALDARGDEPRARLGAWTGPGQTVALVGSSGVGKSTLANALLGAAAQATGGTSAHRDKGRHTTTGRALFLIPSGGAIIDTPGLREIQLGDAGEGIAAVFDDVASLARHCRFADCGHEAEPGCAVRAAMEAGTLAPERLKRYRKMLAEDRRNSESLAEARARHRRFGRATRDVLLKKRRAWDER